LSAPLILILSILVLLSGCTTISEFFAPPDTVSRQNITELRAAHLAFIDEFTGGGGKTWDDARLSARTSAVEDQFTEAKQYESNKRKDAARERAIANLHQQFKSHASFLERRKAFYRPNFARELKTQVESNYAEALRGEDARARRS
jgi:hypothetical protein